MNLSPDEVTLIRTQGTALDGEGVYYVPDSHEGRWRLTLRGHAFFRFAVGHYGLNRQVPSVLTTVELLELKRELLRAKTLELADATQDALLAGELPSQERQLARAFVEGTLEQAMTAARYHAQAARLGKNIIPGPRPAV